MKPFTFWLDAESEEGYRRLRFAASAYLRDVKRIMEDLPRYKGGEISRRAAWSHFAQTAPKSLRYPPGKWRIGIRVAREVSAGLFRRRALIARMAVVAIVSECARFGHDIAIRKAYQTDEPEEFGITGIDGLYGADPDGFRDDDRHRGRERAAPLQSDADGGGGDTSDDTGDDQ